MGWMRGKWGGVREGTKREEVGTKKDGEQLRQKLASYTKETIHQLGILPVFPTLQDPVDILFYYSM